MLIKNNISLTDENRCEFLLSDNGILGQSLGAIKKALVEGYDKSLHFVEYNDLINNPQETMQKIYEFLDEEPFEHTFDNLENKDRENDSSVYGIADMHEVRPTLESTSKDPKDILSPEVIEYCKDMQFWRMLSDDELNDDEFEDELNSSDEENATQLIGV
jgi:sulfotransferase